MRRPIIIAVTVVATMMATPALAHPGFRPDQIPAGQPTEIELAIAHDCERPGGDTSPTTVVDVQVPDGIAEVEPLERDGWTLNPSRDAQGNVMRAEWTRDDGTTESDPPVFRLRVVPATHETTTTIPWKVYQGCESGDYRWGAGSEDEPAIDLTVSPGTYTPPTPSPSDAASPSATEPSAPTPTTPGTTPTPDAGAEEDVPDGQQSGWPWALLALVGVAIGVLAGWWRQRHRDDR